MAIALMSNRGGRGSAAGTNGAVTGAPGENGGSCGQSGCHSAGNFNPSVDVFMLDETGTAVDKYIPGADYTVSLKINHTGLPDGYGFQMVCLEDTGETSTGQFSDLPNRTSIVNLLDRSYVEHFDIIPVDSIPLPWTAPEKGTGNITFYAIGNAVNGIQGPGGDGVARGSFTFEEAQESSTLDIDLAAQYTVYPNPIENEFNIQGPSDVGQVDLYSLSGNRVHVGIGKAQDISLLDGGAYIMHIQTSKGKGFTKKILKI